MRKLLTAVACTLLLQIANAQFDLPAGGGNPRAKITEEVGITDITIKYSRPDVNNREGKIWGNLVTYGFSTQNFTTNKNNSPWRGGANENTTITFEHDVKVQGKDVKAGTYGLHFAVWPDSALIILSNQSNAWGSFYYDEREDAMRAVIKPVVMDKSTEWLKYEFIEHKEKSCTIGLFWEKMMFPFKVDVDVDNIVLARLRDQAKSFGGFNALNMLSAVQYCIQKNINLEEALGWSQRAAGMKTFGTLRTLATVYEKLNRLKEADSVMTEALTLANANQYTGYGRALIAQKRQDRALEILTASQKKHGDIYPVNNGLMFVYSSKGDYKNALLAAEKAKAQAPNDAAKKAIDDNIAKLKEGKDVN
jgi:tetratricopeptide (TPR) repeat protein